MIGRFGRAGAAAGEVLRSRTSFGAGDGVGPRSLRKSRLCRIRVWMPDGRDGARGRMIGRFGCAGAAPGLPHVRRCTPTTFTSSRADIERCTSASPSNLRRRIHQHKTGLIAGFTSKYKVNRLVHFEGFADVNFARAREKQLKGWVRRRKVALIETENPEWEDFADRIGVPLSATFPEGG